VRLWCGAAAAPLSAPLVGHAGQVRAVAWADGGGGGGGLLISGSSDRTVRLWDAASGTAAGEPLTGHAAHVTSLAAFAAGGGGGGALLASGSWDKTVRLWDPRAGAAARLPVLRGHGARVNAVAALAAGAARPLVASACGDLYGDDNAVRLWDAGSGRRLPLPAAAAAHAAPVCAVAFDPAGNLLASADRAGAVVVWDLIRAEARLALAMAWHPRLGAASPLAALEPAAVAAHMHAGE
jgi:WD40 repeat protein